MVVVVVPLTGTRCSGGSGRIGTGIGDSWFSLLGLPLMTSPGRLGLLVVAAIPSLDGTRAVTVIGSLMFLSLVPLSRSVFPGFCPCCLAEVVLAPCPSRGLLLESESET